MNREFLINLLFLISINLLIKPFFTFGIDLQVQNRVGSEAYGLYFALLNFSYIFQVFGDLGIYQYNNRLIAQQPNLLDKYLPKFLMIKGLLGLLAVSLGFVGALLLGYDTFRLHLLGFLLLNQIFITLIFYLRSNISGLQHYRLDSALSALDKLLMIILCSFLLYGPFSENFSIEWFVYAQTTAFGLTALLIFLLVKSYTRQKLRFRLSRSWLWGLLKQSYPYAMVVFLMTIYIRIDGVMLERLIPGVAGAREAGIYAFGYRLLDAVNMLGLLFASLLLPMFARLLKEKGPIVDLLKLSFQLMFTVTVSVSVALYFYADAITLALFDEYSPYVAEVFAMLMMSFNAVGAIYIFGTLLTANGSLRNMNIVFSLGVLLNIGLNYILISEMQAMGAAITTFVTQMMVALAELWLIKRLLELHINWGLLLRLLAFLIAVIAWDWWIYEQLDFYWFWLFALSGLGSLGISIALGIIAPKELLKVIRKR